MGEALTVAARVFSGEFLPLHSHSRVEAVHDMTDYVSQGDGFLMDDNDPSRPMVMYYHGLIMQYAERGDVQSVWSRSSYLRGQ